MNGNIDHLLINIFGIIILAVAIFFVARFVYSVVVSVRQNPVYQAYKDMKKAMRQAQEQMQQQTDAQPRREQQTTQIIGDDEGEYVEFEEVDTP